MTTCPRKMQRSVLRGTLVKQSSSSTAMILVPKRRIRSPSAMFPTSSNTGQVTKPRRYVYTVPPVTLPPLDADTRAAVVAVAGPLTDDAL
jgi:hypothetical protein